MTKVIVNEALLNRGPIKRISIVNQSMDSYYSVGQKLTGGTVSEIKIYPLVMAMGYPCDHYCGFDKDGKLLFSLEMTLPCDVEYL